MSSKRDVSDEQNERHKRMLTQLLKEEGNKYCVDCRTRNPTWASVNLGCFMCLTCSGIHRSLGVHISQVRSTNLDTWLPKQVDFIRHLGNEKVNKFWEANLPPNFRRPPGGSPTTDLSTFIRAKYCEKRYAATDVPPPSPDNYINHPYVAVDKEQASQQAAAPAASSAPATAPGLVVPLPAAVKAPAQPNIDFLGLDVHAPAPSPPAAAAAAAAADDPFSVLAGGTAAPATAPAARTSSPLDDWGDFTSATASALPAMPVAPPAQPAAPSAPAPAPAPAPAQPADPFANLMGQDLMASSAPAAMSKPAPAAAPAATPAAAAKPAKSAEDILRLYDSMPQAQANGMAQPLPAAAFQQQAPFGMGVMGGMGGMGGVPPAQAQYPGAGGQYGAPYMAAQQQPALQMSGMPTLGSAGIMGGYGKQPAGYPGQQMPYVAPAQQFGALSAGSSPSASQAALNQAFNFKF